MLQKSRNRTAVLIYLGMFAFFVVLNALTPYIADDFRYLYSFYDKAHRIESLSDVILSMRAHRYNMNGRLMAHTIVQLLGMLPLWVFDILNAAAYVLQIGVIHQLAKNHAPRSNLILLGIFAGMWLLCPVFGMVNLWQDGALNYMWGTMLGMLFVSYFAEEYLYDKPIRTVWGKACFLGLSFCMGAYSETASSAAIFMAMLFVLLLLVYRKRKCDPFWLVSIFVACVGYVTIYLAPAQWREKGGEMTMQAIVSNFSKVTAYYGGYVGELLLVFAIALVLNLLIRTDRKRLLLALVFFAGSLAANYILIFAQYYVSRSASSTFVYLLAADAVLVYPLLGVRKLKPLLTLVLVVLILISGYSMVVGTQDIYSTYCQIQKNEEYIYECRDNGILDIEVPVITSSTAYSVADSCKYLDTEDASIWPNYSMAYYYEINSIIGVKPE